MRRRKTRDKKMEGKDVYVTAVWTRKQTGR